jgi:hypothetical protein
MTEETYRWNNFYMYFPRGERRNYTDEKSKKIIADLDKILESQKFDTKKLDSIVKRKKEYAAGYYAIFKKSFFEGKKLTEDEKKRVNSLTNLETRNYKLLDKLLEPVVNKMLELGYKLGDLVA